MQKLGPLSESVRMVMIQAPDTAAGAGGAAATEGVAGVGAVTAGEPHPAARKPMTPTTKSLDMLASSGHILRSGRRNNNRPVDKNMGANFRWMGHEAATCGLVSASAVADHKRQNTIR